MQELSGKVPASKPVSEGRSQSAKDGTAESGYVTTALLPYSVTEAGYLRHESSEACVVKPRC